MDTLPQLKLEISEKKKEWRRLKADSTKLKSSKGEMKIRDSV